MSVDAAAGVAAAAQGEGASGGQAGNEQAQAQSQPTVAAPTPAPEVDFDNEASVMAAIQRAEAGDKEHPKPTVKSRRAPRRIPDVEIAAAARGVDDERPARAAAVEAPSADGDQPTGDEPAAAAGDAPTSTPLSPDTRWLLDHHHLPVRDGETNEQARERIAEHDRIRWAKHRNEREELRALAQQQKQQIANIATLEPLFREFAAERLRRHQEEQLAAIPDPETQPAEYNRHQLERIEQRLVAQEQAAAAEREQAAAHAAEQQRLHAFLDVDEQNVGELEQAIASNDDLRRAHHFVSNIIYRDAQRTYPGASPAEYAEFVDNAHVLNMRQMRVRGLSPVSALMEMANDIKTFGGQLWGGGGGNSAPQPAAQPQRHPTTNGNGASTAPTGSPTANRIRTEAAQADARRAVSGATRAGGPGGGSEIDLTRISNPAELAELIMRGKVTDEMIQRQLGLPPRT